MQAKISNYRGGVRTQHPHQMILVPEESSSKEEAKKLLGKKVIWKTPSGGEITGKVIRAHGGKGHVVAKFDRGLPGQALGTAAEIK
ncbi:MAG: 50S ribosomal protein L35ae [Candidatus Altiarchaeales archaeon]|nr:50S ribosomal protein L35ae [Candidatus Altiarchaeales archaeon]